MKKIRCEICGSNQIKKDSESAFVCQDCGMQYDIATVRTLLTEDMQKPCEFTEDQKTNLNSQNALNCSPTFNNESIKNDFQFTVKHCDFVNGCIRILGEVKSGAISKDDKILINDKISVIRDIFYEGKQLSTATIGMSVLIIINSNEKFKIPKGTIIFSAK